MPYQPANQPPFADEQKRQSSLQRPVAQPPQRAQTVCLAAGSFVGGNRGVAAAFLGHQSRAEETYFLAEKKITNPTPKYMSGRDWWWIEMSRLF